MTIVWMPLEPTVLSSWFVAMAWGATRPGSTIRWTSKLIFAFDWEVLVKAWIINQRVIHRYLQYNQNSF